MIKEMKSRGVVGLGDHGSNQSEDNILVSITEKIIKILLATQVPGN